MDNVVEVKETKFGVNWEDGQDWFVGSADMQKVLLSETEIIPTKEKE